MDNEPASRFRIDEHLEIEVLADDTCRLHGSVEVTFPLSSARFVWAEHGGLASLGGLRGALTILLGDDPVATVGLNISVDAAHRLQLFLERETDRSGLH